MFIPTPPRPKTRLFACLSKAKKQLFYKQNFLLFILILIFLIYFAYLKHESLDFKKKSNYSILNYIIHSYGICSVIKIKSILIHLSFFLILATPIENFSYLNKTDSNTYLAPHSTLLKTEITLRQLTQETRQLNTLVFSGESGHTNYSNFVKREKIRDVHLNNLSTQMIQNYLSLFLNSNQKWIPNNFDVNHFWILKGKEHWPEKNWATVFFRTSTNLQLKQVPEKIKEKSIEFTVFILKLEEFALAQNMDLEYFLDNLFDTLSSSEKLSLLFMLSYAVKENKRHQTFKLFLLQRIKSLEARVFAFIKRILDFQSDTLFLGLSVEKNLSLFREMLNAIPAQKSPVLDALIGNLLNRFITQSSDDRIKKECHALYTERSNPFPLEPVITHPTINASL